MAHVIKTTVNTHLKRLFTAGQGKFLANFCHQRWQSQDLTKFTTQNSDLLFNNLKNANSARAVLEIVAQHNNIMNNKHIMQALRSLFTLQKNGESELSTGEILSNKDFRKLCRKLRTQASAIELNETIDALKIVSYVGVPPDATIFQVLLQLIRHNINNLNLQQIIFLDFLISQKRPSPLTEALKIALPLVFEIHLPIKMDYDSPQHLSEYLFFASKNHLSDNSVDKIVGALMRHPEYDGKTAKSIVWSLCDLVPNDVFEPLMKRALDSLVIHFDELNFNEMESTLTKLVTSYSRKSSYFYNETFFDSCASHVIDKDLGYKQSVYILRKFSRVNYFNKFLLDYMCKKVHEDPSLLSPTDVADIYTISVATSLTDYRPLHWDTVKNIISKSENISHSDRKEIIWIKFAAALCLLDVYKLDVLSKCLNESFLDPLLARKSKFRSDFENYTTIWQCIKLFKPELNCLLQRKFDPENLYRNFKRPLDFPLEGALHKALGGENYVKTDLYSKYGIQIDHAVVFRKGGYPVAFNYPEDLEFIEDINVPPENQLIAIIGLRHHNYTLNNKTLRSSTSLNIKVLESLGYPVVPVCLEVWENLPDFEKIPYLMRCIKERTDHDLNLSESVV